MEECDHGCLQTYSLTVSAANLMTLSPGSEETNDAINDNIQRAGITQTTLRYRPKLQNIEIENMINNITLQSVVQISD